jgi:lysophospholipase L1-like esterase
MLSDPVSGKIASVVSGDNSTDAGLTSPFGQFVDYPTLVGIAGQFKIDNMTILANAAAPQVMFIGDSITWEINLLVSQTWPQIVGQQVPKASFVISGRPGASSYGVLGRITSEVQYILPKYLVMMIGTNDASLVSLANYEANVNTIVSQAEALGIQVIICTIPTNGSGAQSSINSENAFLLGLSGVTFVRADIATSVGGDGHTQDTSLFGSDFVHPNALGAAAIAARFATDAPAIFH